MIQIDDLENAPRFGDNAQAGLDFMLQSEEWMYDIREQKKVIDWVVENIPTAEICFMADDDVLVMYDWEEDLEEAIANNDGDSGHRLVVETKSEEDAIAFKLRWL